MRSNDLTGITIANNNLSPDNWDRSPQLIKGHSFELLNGIQL